MGHLFNTVFSGFQAMFVATDKIGLFSGSQGKWPGTAPIWRTQTIFSPKVLRLLRAAHWEWSCYMQWPE